MLSAKRMLLSLLVCQGVALLIGFIWHCENFRSAEKTEDLALLNNILSQEQNGYNFRGTNHHRHKIPNVLIFTHYQNLLLENEVANSYTTTTTGSEEELELLALQKNVRAIIAMHRNATVRFLTDVDCEQSIRNTLGDDTKLVQYFQSEKHGMYKSDICRGAALWETGGLYFDVDLGARMPLWTVLGPFTSFVTVNVHERSKQRPGFFQAFMGAVPNHPIMKRYLELFVVYYEGNLKLETRLLPDKEKHMLGVRILRIAYDEIVAEEEKALKDGRHAAIVDQQLGSSTPMGNVELWQEKLFSKQEFPLIPEPTWGSEKSCKYVVVANEGWPPVAPFYSRIEGSRMCPRNDNTG